MFSKDVTAELNKPLDNKFVASRDQNGFKLDYVEAWYVIDRFNQVFGHGNWERETPLMNLLDSSERGGSHSVHYSAKSRITVYHDADRTKTTRREGWGYGSGYGKNVGQAHEGAIKEAESDAMKRAMMTFGYQFGLALYDKKKENVRSTEQWDKFHNYVRKHISDPAKKDIADKIFAEHYLTMDEFIGINHIPEKSIYDIDEKKMKSIGKQLHSALQGNENE
jgi:recombination DNA repair RAD52 pathway protein